MVTKIFNIKIINVFRAKIARNVKSFGTSSEEQFQVFSTVPGQFYLDFIWSAVPV